MEAAVNRLGGLAKDITRQDSVIALLLISVGYITRVLPHVDNFSPMIAIVLFSGYYFRRSFLVWVVPLATIALTDIVIGFYASMPVIWLCYVGMALIAARFGRSGKIFESAFAGLLGAVGFFVVSNLAVWAEGRLYTYSWQGLIECFVAAVPFFRATLISSLAYTVSLFSLYALYCKLVGKSANGSISQNI